MECSEQGLVQMILTLQNYPRRNGVDTLNGSAVSLCVS